MVVLTPLCPRSSWTVADVVVVLEQMAPLTGPRVRVPARRRITRCRIDERLVKHSTRDTAKLPAGNHYPNPAHLLTLHARDQRLLLRAGKTS
jgi:hypothetical protein